MWTAVLAGCGAMSKAWLDAAAQVAQLQIVGLVDVEMSRAQARADEFGLKQAHVGNDIAMALDATNALMVFDVTPPQARIDLVRTALSCGAHVLTEKPMAASLDEAREIILLAKAAKRIHAVVQNRRYVANVRRIRRFLDSGALGKTTSIHCDFFVAPHFGGFREEMDHVLLLDMAIHTFDAARFIANADAYRVFCREWEPSGSWFKNGSSALAVFDFAGDVTFTYRGSWSAKGFKTSWESQWRIICEHGTLLWDGYEDLQVEIATSEREGLFDIVAQMTVPELNPRDRIGGHIGVIQDFIKAIGDGGEPETNGKDNFKSLAMVFGAIESSKTGNTVRIAV
jgi:predicted dehydrogenase